MEDAARVNIDELARRFASPPREYSPAPIWWWSGERLERGRLRWQLEQLAAGGIYNVVLLNLAPTGPLFGSPRWLNSRHSTRRLLASTIGSRRSNACDSTAPRM